MKRLLWFAAFAFVAAIAILGFSLSPEVLTRWVRQDVAVAVGSQAVTVSDLRHALRDDLWRQGKKWDDLDAAAQATARQQTLDQLVTQLLIRHYRERASPTPADEAAVTHEVTLWKKQFQTDAEAAQRLALHHFDDASLEAYVRSNQLDQAWLQQQIASTEIVSAQEVRAWYDQHRETLRIPTAHRAAHIYLTRHDRTKPADREPEMQALYQSMRSGQATFAETAARFSEDDRSKLRGGDLDWFTADRMPADFMQMIEALKVGQTSPVYATALGWHIIRLTDRKPATVPPFEAVRPEIEALLRTQKRTTALQTFLTNLHQRAEWEGLLKPHFDVIAGVKSL